MLTLSRAIFAILSLTVAANLLAEDAKDKRCYELRIYTAAPGKLDALHSRFRDHTTKLFEKHGMTNVGYWTPTDNKENKLYYILSYPDRKARGKSWGGFMADPDWKAAYSASEKNGRLVNKVESYFLHLTDYSPAVKIGVNTEPRVFEFRDYTTTAGNLKNLNARFRDHTLKLFEKHGMGNFGYWNIDEGQKGADNRLLYLLFHKSAEARDKSFDAFRADPDWVAAKSASEKSAGGSLTTADGVKSVMLTPTDYSPTK